LQKQIQKLQAKTSSKATAADNEEVVLEVDDDEDDEEIDLENSSAVNITKKF
jgi:hypothetical protein